MGQTLIIEYKSADAKEWPGSGGYTGWPITDNTWFVVSSHHDGLSENATYLINEYEHRQIIDQNRNKAEMGFLYPETMYKCCIDGKTYYACGWAGQSFGNFGLTDAYFMARSLNATYDFVRESQFEEYRKFFRGGERDGPSPAIYSNGESRYHYYLLSDVEKCFQRCVVCGGPLVRIKSGDTPIENWHGYWYKFGEKFKLQERQIIKIMESSPVKWRFYVTACRPECEKILLKRAGAYIYERIEQWTRRHHEEQMIQRLTKINFKAKRAMQTGNQAALQSLKKEYEQEATLQI